MSKSRNLLRGVLVVSSVALLAGCADNPIYHKANANTAKIMQQIKQDHSINKNLYQPPQKISVLHRAYVNQIPFIMLPSWMTQSVTLHGEFTLASALAMVVPSNRVNILYSNDVKSSKTVHLDFTGTVKQALNLLQNKLGYHYTVHNNNLRWSYFVTKTFQISLMPGTNSFDLGRQGGHTDTAGKSSQYSTLSGNLSIWKNINNELPELLSKKGHFTVSQASSSVTVTDNWNHVRAVQNWIRHLNKSLGKEVSIRVQILQIRLNKHFSRGINWDLVSKYVAGSFGPSLFSALALKDVAAAAAGGVSFTGSIGSGPLKGSKILIQALSSQGQLSVKNSPIITTLNNQVAEIQQTVNTGYLKQMTVTSSGSSYGESSSPQVSLTPGNIKTGLQLYVLPKIQNNKVFLQISANLSKLTKLASYSPKVSGSTGGQSLVESSIQLPTVETKSFNQRSVLHNGQTLIIAGFNGSTNQTTRTKYFDLPFTGGAAGLTDKTETVLLITPHIIMR